MAKRFNHFPDAAFPGWPMVWGVEKMANLRAFRSEHTKSRYNRKLVGRAKQIISCVHPRGSIVNFPEESAVLDVERSWATSLRTPFKKPNKTGVRQNAERNAGRKMARVCWEQEPVRREFSHALTIGWTFRLFESFSTPTASLPRALLSMLLILVFTKVEFAASMAPQYSVTYSGGSLPAKGGDGLKLRINPDSVGLFSHKAEIIRIPASSITEISYGQEVHRRVGTAIGLAVVSLGIGAFMLLAKSKKHYIGLTWDDHGNKGGVALQADKNEFRGVLAALEGISGKKAVNTDPVK